MDQGRLKSVADFLKKNGIKTRADWGARATNLEDKPENLDWDYNTVVIHHSGLSGEDDPQKIQSKHMDKNKWDDIGYHFIVDDAGTIYEGRSLVFKGSHTENANTGKIGILVAGNFEKMLWGIFGGTPSAHQVIAVKALIRALKSQLFPALLVLGGHKDFKKTTECPGNQLYPLLAGWRTDLGLNAPP